MELTVKKRNIFGRKTKVLRKQGLIPAELYGHSIPNLHLSVSLKDFQLVYKEAGKNSVVDLVVSEDKDRRPVMIHEVSLNPVNDEIMNIDFYQIRLDEKIIVQVPLEFKGLAPAVKDKGGVLIKSLQEVEVEALANNIPHNITVDLTKIVNIGENIHVRELDVPSGVKMLLDGETVVATVVEKAAEEEQEIKAEVEEITDEAKTGAEDKKQETTPGKSDSEKTK